MGIPVISNVFPLYERDSDFLDIQNVAIPPPQDGRILVIAVLAVSSNNPGAIVDDITFQGSFLGNGIIQIGNDAIAQSQSGNNRYAMAGLYYAKNPVIGSVPLRVQISTQEVYREMYAVVYSVTGVKNETRDTQVGGASENEIAADDTFGANLTTLVNNCLVVDHWAVNTSRQAGSTIFQTPVAREHYGRGVSIITSIEQPVVGVATFTQQIDEDNLAQAWQIVAWPGLSNPPTDVNAGGPYSGVVNTDIAIAGTFTDGDITPVTVLWEIVSGGTGTFANPISQATTFTPDNTGTYTLRFTVDDGENPPVSATTTLDSTDIPPTDVDAGGPYSYEVDIAGAISGGFTVGTDPVPTVKWTILSGGTGTFADDTALATTFKPNSIAVYVLRMTISPVSGPDVVDTAAYESLSIPPKNVDAGGPYSGDHNTPIQLTGLVDLGTDATPAYAWSIISGGSGSFSNFSSPNPTFTPNSTGAYVLQFSVDPNTGPAVTDTANLDSIHVPPSNVDAGGPYTGPVRALIQLQGAFSVGTSEIPTLLWTVVSGGTGVISDASIINPTFDPDNEGPYVLRFSVDDTFNPPVTDDADLEATAPAPPTDIDAGGPYDGAIGIALPIQGSFTPGSFPSTVLWTQESGVAIGVFGDPTALSTTFTLPAGEVVTLRLTVTPTQGAVGFNETQFSAKVCLTPPISLNFVTHLTTDVYLEYQETFDPVFSDGDLSINRLRVAIDSSYPATEMTVVQQIGSNLRLFFSADLSTYHISDATGNSAASIVLAQPLPMDILFLLGIRLTWIDVGAGQVSHEIFVNNISQGIITVSNLATNAMGRMFTGRAGVSYLSIQHEFKLATELGSIYITAPVSEGAGINILAKGTNCLNFPAEIGGLHGFGDTQYIWNLDTIHLNDAILRALDSAVGATTLNDGLLKYYQLHDATSNISRDAEREFLIARGVTPGQTHDMWFEFLVGIPSLQLQGSLMDMKLQWWSVGAPIR